MSNQNLKTQKPHFDFDFDFNFYLFSVVNGVDQKGHFIIRNKNFGDRLRHNHHVHETTHYNHIGVLRRKILSQPHIWSICPLKS